MNFSQLNFGVFAIKIYGFFLAIAFVVAVWNFYGRIKQKEFSADFFLHHFWRWVLGGIVLGRIFALIFMPEIFSQYGIFAFLAFWEGELNSWGFLFGSLLTMYIDLKNNKESFFKWLDLLMPSLFLGLLVLDFAQFLTGVIYGKETNLPWGVYYETFGVELLNALHPVSLYAMLVHIWILRWIYKNEKRFQKFPGMLALKTGMILFSADFLLQFLRGDETILLFDFLRIEQVFDLLLVFGCWGILRLRKK